MGSGAQCELGSRHIPTRAAQVGHWQHGSDHYRRELDHHISPVEDHSAFSSVTRTLEDTPSVRGMINAVKHLVEVVEEK